MLTATTKSLLAPIADAVSQLIVITAEAEIAHSPIPDLRDVSRLVAQHVSSLSDIGNALIDPTALAVETRGHIDVSKLQQEMTSACTEVRKAGELLVSVSDTLWNDPLSADGRKQLVEATKGILQGTQRILNTYDDSEVQKTLVVAKGLIEDGSVIIQTLDQFYEPTNTENDDTLSKSIIEQVRTFAEKSVYLYHLVHARIPEILSPPIQHILERHLSSLNTSSVGAVSALKLLMVGTTNTKLTILDMVKSHFNLHVKACEGITRYFSLEDISHEFSDAPNGGLSEPGSLTHNTTKNTQIRSEPVNHAISQFTSLLCSSDTSEDSIKNKKNKVYQAISQLVLDLSTISGTNDFPLIHSTAGLLQQAVNEATDVGTPISARPAHVARIQGLMNHLSKQIRSANTISRQINVGSTLAALEDSKSAGAALRDMINSQNGQSELVLHPFSIAVKKTEEKLLNLGLVTPAKELRRAAPNIIEAGLVLKQLDGTDEMSQETAQSYMNHVLNEWDTIVNEAANQVNKELPLDTLISGLGLNVLSAAQVITENNAKSYAVKDLEQLSTVIHTLLASETPEVHVKKLKNIIEKAAEDVGRAGLNEYAQELRSLSESVTKSAEDVATASQSQKSEAFNKLQGVLDQYLATVDTVQSEIIHQQVVDNTIYDLNHAKLIAGGVSGLRAVTNPDEIAEIVKTARRAMEALNRLGSIQSSAELEESTENLKSATEDISQLVENGQDVDPSLLVCQTSAFRHFNEAVNKSLVNVQETGNLHSTGLLLLNVANARKAADALSSGKDENGLLTQFKHASQMAVSCLNTHGSIGAGACLAAVTAEVAMAFDQIAQAKSQGDSTSGIRALNRLETALIKWGQAADLSEKKIVEIAQQNSINHVVTDLINSQNRVLALDMATDTKNSAAIETSLSDFTDAANLLNQRLEKLGLIEQQLQIKGNYNSVISAVNKVTQSIRQHDPIALKASHECLRQVIDDYNSTAEHVKKNITVITERKEGFPAIAIQSAQAFNSSDRARVVSPLSGLLDANMNQLTQSFNGFVRAVRREADNTDDSAYKSKIESTLSNMLIPNYTDMESISKVHKLVNQCINVVGANINQHISGAIKPIPPSLLIKIEPPPIDTHDNPSISNGPSSATSPDKLTEIETGNEDVVIVHDEAPVLLSIEEAKTNPIKAMAQELRVEASRWSEKDNDLVATVTTVAQRLRELSEVYRTHSPQSKLSLLSSTKEIVAYCTQVQNLVNQLSLACTDRRLRLELVAAANRLPTLSQQLKILASVRASAGPDDGDSERQLVTCSQNLILVVKEVLGKSEVASIRVNRAVVASKVGVAVIKFKRNLFRGRSSANRLLNESNKQSSFPNKANGSLEHRQKNVKLSSEFGGSTSEESIPQLATTTVSLPKDKRSVMNSPSITHSNGPSSPLSDKVNKENRKPVPTSANINVVDLLSSNKVPHQSRPAH